MDELDEIILGVGMRPTPQTREAFRKMLGERGGLVNTAGRLSAKGNRNQEILDLKIEQYRQAGVVTSQSSLRAETPLTGSVNSIPFNFLASGQSNSNESIPTQILLGQNDTFTVTGMALYLKRATRTAGQNPTDTEHAIAPLYTFPNPVVFPGANEAANLQAIYNGTIQIKLDTTVFNPVYPALAHYRVPQSQQGVGAATGVTGVQRDEWPLPYYGKADAKPTFEIGGQTQFTVIEDLRASVNLAAVSTTARNYAVLILTGLLHSGANSEYQARMKKSQRQ